MNLKKLLTQLVNGYPRCITHANANDSYTSYEFRLGSIRLVTGMCTIQPSAASRSTTKSINYGCSITTPVNCLLTLAGQPEIATLTLSVTDLSTSTFTANIFASNTTSRIVRFLAIGLG